MKSKLIFLGVSLLPSIAAAEAMPEVQGSILKSALYLAVLSVGALWLLRRKRTKISTGQKESIAIKQTVSLGAKARLVTIEYNGSVKLLGVTEQSVTLLDSSSEQVDRTFSALDENGATINLGGFVVSQRRDGWQ